MIGKIPISLLIRGIIISLYLSSCTFDSCDDYPDVSEYNVDIAIIRLEDELMALETEQEAKAFMQKYKVYADEIQLHFQLEEMQKRALYIDMVNAATNQYTDTLYQETKDYFKDLSWLEDELTLAAKLMKYYYPKEEFPPLYTVVTGFGIDAYATDKAMVLGLDFFNDAGRYRPEHVPDYMIKRRKPHYIVPSLLTFYSDMFMPPAGKTMIENMVAWGKAYYFVKKLAPCTADSVIIGYDSKQWEEAESYEGEVWQHFVDNELFFKKDIGTVQRYVGEAPFTSPISTKAPGRLGQWLGWKIVNAYMAKQKVSLQQLMEEPDANKILQQSGYKPI